MGFQKIVPIYNIALIFVIFRKEQKTGLSKDIRIVTIYLIALIFAIFRKEQKIGLSKDSTDLHNFSFRKR